MYGIAGWTNTPGVPGIPKPPKNRPGAQTRPSIAKERAQSARAQRDDAHSDYAKPERLRGNK